MAASSYFAWRSAAIGKATRARVADTHAAVGELHDCVNGLYSIADHFVPIGKGRQALQVKGAGMGSVIQEAEEALAVVANVAVTISVDTTELQAGQPVSLPKVQVGSLGGKAVYLEGTLSLT